MERQIERKRQRQQEGESESECNESATKIAGKREKVMRDRQNMRKKIMRDIQGSVKAEYEKGRGKDRA